MQKRVSREQALKNAFASARMEGFNVTQETQRDCERLLSKKITTAELIAEILKTPRADKQVR